MNPAPRNPPPLAELHDRIVSHERKTGRKGLVRDEMDAIASHWLHSPGAAPLFLGEADARAWRALLKRHGLSLPADFSGIPFPPPEKPRFTFIDLFAGIGGFRVALQSLGGKCVFTSEWDKHAQATYRANFGEVPFGDITKIPAAAVPDHDLLCGGFPCQAFSIAGKKGGFEDSRGTLFFDIARILREKQPSAFFLENVKGLASHCGGRTLATILGILRDELGYFVPEPEVLKAEDFGVPQKRGRLYLVGFHPRTKVRRFRYPAPFPEKAAFRDVKETGGVSARYYLSTVYAQRFGHELAGGAGLQRARRLPRQRLRRPPPAPARCACRAGGLGHQRLQRIGHRGGRGIALDEFRTQRPVRDQVHHAQPLHADDPAARTNRSARGRGTPRSSDTQQRGFHRRRPRTHHRRARLPHHLAHLAPHHADRRALPGRKRGELRLDQRLDLRVDRRDQERRRRIAAAQFARGGEHRRQDARISCRRLPGRIATRVAPAGHGSSGVGFASVRFTDSTSGCPTKTVFSPVPLNTSTSNGKITISRSRIFAIFGIRLLCHAQTCGLT
jgi:site-specific DNA-cytosine methylase